MSQHNYRLRQRTTTHQARRRLFVEPLEARLCLAGVPAFSSLPGANHTLYLDFDGHTTQGTTWNAAYNVTTIVSPPYDIDNDPGTFSATELQRITDAFKWVAEDFAPFEINVTTVDPGPAALSYSGGGDTQWGTRVVITDDTFANCGCGGHAYVGSFDDSQDEPVFVYNTSLKGVSEATTHEAGHALGLTHDGHSGGSYYSGHGSGATSWAPLMGVSYNRNVTQWSKGEYYTATNSQDDLAIIASLGNGNGFGYRADDHGDSNGAATVLSTSGGAISSQGIIETTSDIDVFAFTTDAGNVVIDIDPVSIGANLDIKADLYNSGGSLVATSNSDSVLDAGFNLNLTAGQYFLHVDGTGTGSPLTASPTGYTDYGSLGQFTVSGTVIDPGDLPALSINDLTVDEFAGTATFTVSLSGTVTDPVTIDFATANGTATAGSDYVATSGSLNFTAAGTQSVSVSIIDDGQTEGSENFAVNLSNASGAIVSDGQGIGTIIDNDASVSINDVSGNEGNVGKGKKNSGNPQLKDFVFTVSLSNVLGHAVTVSYATADGTATEANDDYRSNSGNVTIPAGQISQTVTVVVVGDNTQESDETFSVVLSSPSGANLGDATGTGTIQDDDSKGNGNGKGKNKAPAEIELQDPRWWFDGPEDGHDHVHAGEFDMHEGLPAESYAASFVAAGQVRATLLDGLKQSRAANASSELADLALTDLAPWLAAASDSALPASDDLVIRNTGEDSTSETELDAELLDALADDLNSEWF